MPALQLVNLARSGTAGFQPAHDETHKTRFYSRHPRAKVPALQLINLARSGSAGFQPAGLIIQHLSN